MDCPECGACNIYKSHYIAGDNSREWTIYICHNCMWTYKKVKGGEQ